MFHHTLKVGLFVYLGLLVGCGTDGSVDSSSEALEIVPRESSECATDDCGHYPSADCGDWQMSDGSNPDGCRLKCPRGGPIGLIGVHFECNKVHVVSCKDLSNVVVEFEDGQHFKYDGLKGHYGTFGAGDRHIAVVWVKAGNNASGDGPGYGKRFVSDRTDCEPTGCIEEDGGNAVKPPHESECDLALAEHFAELPDLSGLAGADAKELLESFWSGLYDQIEDGDSDSDRDLDSDRDPDDFFHGTHLGSGFTWEVLAKAKPDECFQGVGNPANRTDPVLGFDANYPGDLDAAQMQMCREIVVGDQYATPSDSGLAQPKVNQAYVWGLTRERSAPCSYREGNLWFGTIPNTHCLVLSGFLQITAPSLNNSWVCEGGIADARPPRAFYYNTEDNELHEATQAILGGGIVDNLRLRSTIGLRSAGSANGVVFLGGIGVLPGGASTVNLFAFSEETKAYLGSASFPDYNNIRQWRLIRQELYVGVGLSSGGGEVLRWTGSVSDPFQFETVGQIAGDPAYLTPHEGRVFVSAWPNGPGETMSIWMSPKLGSDRKLTGEDAAQWQSVWTISDHDPELSVVLTTGGGALMSYGGHLYWGTMHVPGLSLLAWQGIYGGIASEEDATAAILGTYRPISIFRASALGTSEQKVELLYGNRFLPAYSPAQGWQIVPNNMGQGPRYGLSGLNNFFNNYTWWMEVFDGRLFVGTMDFLYLAGELLGNALEVPEVFIEAFEHFAGADLWRFDSSCHRARPVSLSGVGNISSYGVRTMVSDDALYLGMANPMNLLTDPNDDLPEGGWELIELDSD